MFSLLNSKGEFKVRRRTRLKKSERDVNILYEGDKELLNRMKKQLEKKVIVSAEKISEFLEESEKKNIGTYQVSEEDAGISADIRKRNSSFDPATSDDAVKRNLDTDHAIEEDAGVSNVLGKKSSDTDHVIEENEGVSDDMERRDSDSRERECDTEHVIEKNASVLEPTHSSVLGYIDKRNIDTAEAIEEDARVSNVLGEKNSDTDHVIEENQGGSDDMERRASNSCERECDTEHVIEKDASVLGYIHKKNICIDHVIEENADVLEGLEIRTNSTNNVIEGDNRDFNFETNQNNCEKRNSENFEKITNDKTTFNDTTGQTELEINQFQFEENIISDNILIDENYESTFGEEIETQIVNDITDEINSQFHEESIRYFVTENLEEAEENIIVSIENRQKKYNLRLAQKKYSFSPDSSKDPFDCVELSEEEFQYNSQESSESDNEVSSHYSFDGNDHITAAKNSVETVRKNLFKNELVSQYLNTNDKGKFNSDSENLKVIQETLQNVTTPLIEKDLPSRNATDDREPSTSGIKARVDRVSLKLEIKKDFVTTLVLQPLHKGIYEGHLHIPKDLDSMSMAYFRGEITSACRHDKHICNFKSDKTSCGMLQRKGLKFTLQVYHCISPGISMNGMEVEVPNSDLRLTALSVQSFKEIVEEMSSSDLRQIKTKQHCCVYCGRMQTALPRHILTLHKDEPEVKMIRKLKPASKERVEFLEKLRVKGDLQYNKKIETIDRSIRIPVRKPSKASVSNYRYCPCCQKLIGRRNFARHVRNKHNQCVRTYRRKRECDITDSILPNNEEDIVNSLRLDDIGKQAINDSVILLLAKHYTYDNYMLQHRKQNIIASFRRLARLLQVVKQLEPDVHCFEDCLVPERYDIVMNAIVEITSLHSKSLTDTKPQLALQYGPLLTNVANRFLIELQKNSDQTAETLTKIGRVEKFVKLHEKDFKHQITRRALVLQTLKRNNKRLELPKTEDILKFTAHLTKIANEAAERLEANGFDFSTWKTLGEALLCQIVVFNRRRVGEASRITLENYNKKKRIDEQDYKHLTRLEIVLAKEFSVMYIIGKRVRPLPVLLKSVQEKQLDLFLRFRAQAGVPLDNKYLFGYAVSDGHFNASRLMTKFAKESGAMEPEFLRGTILRRQVATASQYLNLSDNEIQELADFMGHDVSVHKKFYRQPSMNLEVTKIARFFCVVGDVNIHRHRGKTMDELEPFMAPEDYDSSDCGEDGVVDNVNINDNYNDDENDNGIFGGNLREDDQDSNRLNSDVQASSSLKQKNTLNKQLSGESTMKNNDMINISTPRKRKFLTEKVVTPKKQRTNFQKKELTPKKQTVKDILHVIDMQRSPKWFREKRRRVINRATWSASEAAFMKSKFKNFLNPAHPLPSKQLINDILEKNKNQLKETRNADNMYAWIQNQRRKVQNEKLK